MGNVQPGMRGSIGGRTVEVVRQLAEGGFAYVYLVRDVADHTHFAVKRLIVNDREDLEKVKEEIGFMKMIPAHKNIVKFHAAHSTAGRAHGSTEIYILMEYCTGPSLYHILDSRFDNSMSEMEVLHIFSEVCEAVAHLHSLSPPVAHRDIKVENVLKQGTSYKLCDFGSATTREIRATDKLSMCKAEEEIQRYTTMMYRSPEMIDLYQRKVINEKVDVWALGCLLYRVCFFRHPFEDGSNLAILNVNYQIPRNSPYSERLHHLIKYMIEPDPDARPDMYQVLERVCELRHEKMPPLNESVFAARRGQSFDATEEEREVVKKALPPSPQQGRRGGGGGEPLGSVRVAASTPVIASGTGGANALFDLLDGGGGSQDSSHAPPHGERQAAAPSAQGRRVGGSGGRVPASAPQLHAATKRGGAPQKLKPVDIRAKADMDDLLFGGHESDDDDDVPSHIAVAAAGSGRGKAGATAAARSGRTPEKSGRGAAAAAGGSDAFADMSFFGNSAAPASTQPPAASNGSFFDMFADNATSQPAPAPAASSLSPAASPSRGGGGGGASSHHRRSVSASVATGHAALSMSDPSAAARHAPASPAKKPLHASTTSAGSAGSGVDLLFAGFTSASSSAAAPPSPTVDLLQPSPASSSPGRGHRRSVSEAADLSALFSTPSPAAAASPARAPSWSQHHRSPSGSGDVFARNYSALHSAGFSPMGAGSPDGSPARVQAGGHVRSPSAGAAMALGGGLSAPVLGGGSPGSMSPNRSPYSSSGLGGSGLGGGGAGGTGGSGGGSVFEALSGIGPKGSPQQPESAKDDPFSNLAWK